MPVYELVEHMPYTEYLGWHQYFEENPIGRDEDRRTALIMSAFGAKINPEKLFPSLARKARKDDPQNLKNSFVFKLMQNAQGGDKIV